MEIKGSGTVHSHLPDRLVLKVRTNGVHLALVDAHAPELEEGLLGVVHAAEAIPVDIICDFVVVPDWDPGEVLMCQSEIGIRAVLGDTSAVVIKTDDFFLRRGSTDVSPDDSVFVLIYIIPQVDHEVNIVLTGGVAVGVKVAVRVVRAGEHGNSKGSSGVILRGGGLGTANRGGVAGAADRKSVVVRSKRSKPGSLNLLVENV